MQYSRFTLFLAAIVAPLASAQMIPSCASDIFAGLNTATVDGCSVGDMKCICASTPFLTSLASKVRAACDAEDIQLVYSYAESICSAAGVTIAIPTGSISQSAGATATPTTKASSTSASSTSTHHSTSSATGTAAASTNAAEVAHGSRWVLSGALGAAALAVAL